MYQLDTTGMEQLTGGQTGVDSIELMPGESMELPNGLGTVEFETATPDAASDDFSKSVPRFASFDVHHDPSQGWVLVFAILIIGGLLLSLFVPRRRTEFLTRCAAEKLMPGDVVVDMCCGSGAVGAVLAHSVAGIGLYAVDVDPVAVRCARRNIERFGGRVFTGDLCAPLPASIAGRVDVLVANAPYVPSHAVAFMDQLPLRCPSAFFVQHVIHRNGNLPGDMLHKLDLRILIDSPLFAAEAHRP